MFSLRKIFQTVTATIQSYFIPPAMKVATLPNGNLGVFIPLDLVKTSTICDLLDASAPIQQLVLGPPLNQQRLLDSYDEISETLVWFLKRKDDLKHLDLLALTLDLAYDRRILRALEELSGLRVLEFTVPATYSLNTVPEDSQATLLTNVGLMIEKVPQLEHVVIPENWAVGTLKDLLERTFKYKRFDNLARVRYHTRARNLLYGTPAFLVPYL